jgi:pimeloyl-ACP methyl ester carboxylesterase
MEQLSRIETMSPGHTIEVETAEFTEAASENWITLDGARMRYLRQGSGPPLVLVHGLLGYSFSWRFVIPPFARHSTVYTLDMLGAGFSDRPSCLDCTLRSGATHLLRILDLLKINDCDLLGTSYGGATAMMAAALAPDRIRRMVLAAPVNPWSAHGRLLAPFLCHPLIAPLFLRIFPRAQLSYGSFLGRLFGGRKEVPPDSLEGYSIPLRIPGVLEHAMKILLSWNDDLKELEAALPKIEHIPTLLIWGAQDRAVAANSAYQLQKHFQFSEVTVFEGVGHLPYEEAPDKFAHAVAKFLWPNKPIDG